MICDKIDDCIEVLDRAIEICRDPKGGKSTFRIENEDRKQYSKVNFEDCVYDGKENETKCDYAFIHRDVVYFVELKGSDVQKGYAQLAATIIDTKKCFQDKEIKARLVVTKNGAPKIAKKSSGYKNLVKNTKDIVVKQHILTEKI
ncbi:MAG: hypothetical protein CMC13_11650 [Flavobacteriaceae bacterium]|nr:hypothetical protein [Flavobacteriaceae bacterium]|tara:strand:+ start:4018 stop:4452 length:435 start_codon:yes stop_codon:yes gene_type:complete